MIWMLISKYYRLCSVTLLRAALVTFFGDLGGIGLQAAVLVDFPPCQIKFF